MSRRTKSLRPSTATSTPSPASSPPTAFGTILRISSRGTPSVLLVVALLATSPAAGGRALEDELLVAPSSGDALGPDDVFSARNSSESDLPYAALGDLLVRLGSKASEDRPTSGAAELLGP